MSGVPATLTPDERRLLLEAVVETLHPDRDDEDILHTFLPIRAHGELLRDTAVLVEGERGSGKTAIFHFLSAIQDKGWRVGEVIPRAPERLRWAPGFAERGTAHPSVAALTRWAAGRSREELERFWLGHLGGRMVEDGLVSAPSRMRFLTAWQARRNEIEEWVGLLGREMSAFQSWLDLVQDRLVSEYGTVIFGYDDLDRLTSDQGIASAAPLVGALVSVWVGLVRRYRALRARIFLRPDLSGLVRTSTTDASKLEGYTARLQWSQEDVFRVLLRRLGKSKDLRAWLDEGETPIRFDWDKRLGWMPPYALLSTGQQMFSFVHQSKEVTASVATQESLAGRLAGTMMGTGAKKGYTHTWILNHSRDGLGRSLPRVTLNLVRFAAEVALERGPLGREDRILHPSELEAAQERTGQQRLDELEEAHPVVRRLRRLRGTVVPIPEAETIANLGARSDEDGFGDDGWQVLQRLVDLGVVILRPPPRAGGPQRVDVPDLFRKSLQIRRKGGPLQLLHI